MQNEGKLLDFLAIGLLKLWDEKTQLLNYKYETSFKKWGS